MRKSIIVSTLVLVGTIASPALLYAQTDPNSATMETTSVSDRDNDGNWGWIGLFGLAGLLGLKRSNRERTNDLGRARAST